jgi:antibiotic biosynthesis monooxygenase (ABM) superfamily enzyme
MAHTSSSEPITLIFNWKVKSGKEKQFEKWAHEITHAAMKFEGHLGANWIKASNNQNYTLIYKFDTYEHFKKWEHSEIRKKLLKEGLSLSEQEKPNKIQQLTGLETWFTLPGNMTVKPPPKWKMAIATIIGIYPVALIFQILFGQQIQRLPIYLKPLALGGFAIPIMTFFVMPNVTKLLKKWLYPEK